MQCPKCGTAIPDGSRVCRRCRTHIPGDSLWRRLLRRLGSISVGNPDGDGTSVVTRTTRVETFRVQDPTTGEFREYDSADELPPDIRQRIDELQQQARAENSQTLFHTRISVTDQDGQTRHFNSAEEMPPELRAAFDRAKSEAAAGRTRIVVTDANGAERTFDSVDALPPDLRAIYLDMQQRARRGT